MIKTTDIEQKKLLVILAEDPLKHPSAQEGLRCARGLAADGRWSVTIGVCEQGLSVFQAVGDEGGDPNHDLDVLADRRVVEKCVALVAKENPPPQMPGWVEKLTAEEWLFLGKTADVILKF